jgi:predicted DNA-binding transcriptional regulator AlpA
MSTPSIAPRRALRTTDAARYLGISPSLLRKMRTRGPNDPSSRGPSYIRLSPSLIVYELAELDRWLDGHRSHASYAA